MGGLAAEYRSVELDEAAAFVRRQTAAKQATPGQIRIVAETAERSSETCAKRHNRNLTIARLYLIDIAAANHQPFEQRLAAIQSAHKTVVQALTCSPLDSSYWPRLAKLESAAVYEPTRLRELLQFAVWTAPYEGAAMEDRMRTLTGIRGRMLMVVNRDVVTDFGRFVRWARLKVVARALNRWGEELPKAVAEEISSLQPARLRGLKRAGYRPPDG